MNTPAPRYDAGLLAGRACANQTIMRPQYTTEVQRVLAFLQEMEESCIAQACRVFLRLLAWGGPRPAHDVFAHIQWPHGLRRSQLGIAVRRLSQFRLISATGRKRRVGNGTSKWYAPVWRVTDQGWAEVKR